MKVKATVLPWAQMFRVLHICMCLILTDSLEEVKSFSCARESGLAFAPVSAPLAGVHHDRVPAAELARRPPVLQPHQQDAGFGQPICGQAVAA